MDKSFQDYSYGVNEQYQARDFFDEKVLELQILGFTTLESEISASEIEQLKIALDEGYKVQAEEIGGHEKLVEWGDANILRGALASDKIFLDVALNDNLLTLASRYLGTEFILTMQNGLINKPGHGNAQGKYHRDLNYQHWTSSKPIAMNALLCLDDFTIENGATWVVPSTHRFATFPTLDFLNKFSHQVVAKAGTFLVLDGMLFHKAGSNKTEGERRAINHVLGLPFLGQTIDLPNAMNTNKIPLPNNPKHARYLGSQWNPSATAKDWRKKKFTN